jgi:iron complex transport system ATP-binding protein
VASGFTATKLTAFSVEPTAVVREAVAAALARVSVTHLADRALATLSTGERRRVLIARSLVHAPELLVLDEPTTGLDLAARHQFLTILSGLIKQPGLTLLVVTHHLEEIVPGFEHVVLLQRGQVAFDGPASEALTPERLSVLFGVPVGLTHDSTGRCTAAVASPETPN